jgi:hypothetical protein
VYADPVIAVSPLVLEADADVVAEIGRVSAGRPLVIDYRVSRFRGIAVGDLVVEFAREPLTPRYVEITPIAGVRVLVERQLISLIGEGSRLRWRRRLLGYRLVVSLGNPEGWVEFINSRGSCR